MNFFRKLFKPNAANKEPGDAATYFNMGNVYYKQGEYPRAIDAFQKAIELTGLRGGILQYGKYAR
jgi:cytochrome c-type biogenesis protein CcmH/NrfG